MIKNSFFISYEILIVSILRPKIQYIFVNLPTSQKKYPLAPFFISVALEELGGVRLFPFTEDVRGGCADEVYRVDDARDWIFASAEDGELDGEDALVEATVTVGVGEGSPCGEDVGGVR